MVRKTPDDEVIIGAVMAVSDALHIGHRSVPLFPLNLKTYGVLSEDVQERHILEAMRRHVITVRGRTSRVAASEPVWPKIDERGTMTHAPVNPQPEPEPRLLGVELSTLLQWMGSQAWPEDDADVVLAELGQPRPLEEISAWLAAGRKSAERFDLPDHVVAKLNEARGIF